MESYLVAKEYDLVTPDGRIVEINQIDRGRAQARIQIDQISPAFIGHQIERELVHFNLKSTLAQLGLDVEEASIDLGRESAQVELQLVGIGAVGRELLQLLKPGAHLGKLFAADPRRRVRDPDYLMRMLGRVDRQGLPLLSLGGQELICDVIDGRTIAYVDLLPGKLIYDEKTAGFLPAIARSLEGEVSVRDLLSLHQEWHKGAIRTVTQDELLLVKTKPLHVRTVFGMVVNTLLPRGVTHTAANVLQPDTMHSGDIYELHGQSEEEVVTIPLEFYTLEPHREHVFFSDRDQLQAYIDKPEALKRAFATAPQGRASVFVVKGSQLDSLEAEDWIVREPVKQDFPGFGHGQRQAALVEEYIQSQACYPFLRAMEDGLITSQGILLCRYLPSPLIKRMLLSEGVYHLLKGLYFTMPSQEFGDYFSHEDRAMLLDLSKFGIPIYWIGKEIQIFVPRADKDCGMFVPLDCVAKFQRATFFGIYGSNLHAGIFEQQLRIFLRGARELFGDEPLAMVTGGGPGVMELGNRLAQEMGILSCANIVDFGSSVHEQKVNPYIDCRMTYRLDKLVERQAEFYLDYPIFLQGGIGTDFEYALEEVRMKIGSATPRPILLFGSPDYWREKITSRFQCNLQSGTIKGSEWVSNAFFAVQTPEQALEILRKFREGSLDIGPTGPVFQDGFRG